MPIETSPPRAPKRTFVRLEDDNDWFDEVEIVGQEGPCMRLVTRYRFKTSGLSGDKWRTSVVWTTNLEMEGTECAPWLPVGWMLLDGPYHDIATGCAAVYPGVYSAQKPFHAHPTTAVNFKRKGFIQFQCTDQAPLLVALGHLPWGKIIAGDKGAVNFEALELLCFQPGCANPGRSVYRLRKKYERGREVSWYAPDNMPHVRFCATHLQRGNSSFEDSDDNYEVVEGLGPQAGARGAALHEKKAVFGGVVNMPPEKP